ncbi:SEL1-like repeat protein [Temperatibacter marinus]|uniref:SEL1-like repeat protein n=1 Tax=Temperatibacter marinus TaxID=1456591 RepID=A0AA52EH69_9PROT|nr:SEL1-like repeat protein [Temperatibacter marinus]WND02449.1 SEL1-like repeat protein [Temperatibacter marinus]
MGCVDKELEAFVFERLSAARQGQKTALYDLGLLYSAGQGVEKNNIEAYKFFNLAARRGLKRAKVDLHDVSKIMKGTEIKEAKQKCKDWLHL